MYGRNVCGMGGRSGGKGASARNPRGCPIFEESSQETKLDPPSRPRGPRTVEEGCYLVNLHIANRHISEFLREGTEFSPDGEKLQPQGSLVTDVSFDGLR